MEANDAYFLTVGSYPPDILSLIFSSLPHHVKLPSVDFHLVYSATTSRIVIRTLILLEWIA